MHSQLLILAPLAGLAAATVPVAIDAGGPQSPPASTSASLTAEPTVATIITDGSGSTIVAPLPPGNPGYPTSLPADVSSVALPTETIPSVTDTGYPTSSPPPGVVVLSSTTYTNYPATTPLPHPIINGTVATGGSGPTGNLSTTLGSSTTVPTSGSTVLITTTDDGGKPVTRTSVVAASPTGESGGSGGSGAGQPSGSGSVQPGAGSKVQAGAAMALALFAGVGALLL